MSLFLATISAPHFPNRVFAPFNPGRIADRWLLHHPKIEAAEVIGVLDEKYGEESYAGIKLHEAETATEGEIRDFCRERIAHFKILRYILSVDDFPVTITGKVQKYKMRKKNIGTLGLG